MDYLHLVQHRVNSLALGYPFRHLGNIERGTVKVKVKGLPQEHNAIALANEAETWVTQTIRAPYLD